METSISGTAAASHVAARRAQVSRQAFLEGLQRLRYDQRLGRSDGDGEGDHRGSKGGFLK